MRNVGLKFGPGLNVTCTRRTGGYFSEMSSHEPNLAFQYRFTHFLARTGSRQGEKIICAGRFGSDLSFISRCKVVRPGYCCALPFVCFLLLPLRSLWSLFCVKVSIQYKQVFLLLIPLIIRMASKLPEYGSLKTSSAQADEDVQKDGDVWFDADNAYYLKDGKTNLTAAERGKKLLLICVPIFTALLIVGGAALFLLRDFGNVSRPDDGAWNFFTL